MSNKTLEVKAREITTLGDKLATIILVSFIFYA
jgi:hypothetical protein